MKIRTKYTYLEVPNPYWSCKINTHQPFNLPRKIGECCCCGDVLDTHYLLNCLKVKDGCTSRGLLCGTCYLELRFGSIVDHNINFLGGTKTINHEKHEYEASGFQSNAIRCMEDVDISI